MLHVITALTQGGAEAVLHRLVAGSPSSCRHTVVSMMDEGVYGPLLRECGAMVFSLGMPRGRLTWRGVGSLFRIIRQAEPDVVQTWMYHADLIGGMIARLAGVRRVVWSIHSPNLDPDKVSALTRLVATVSAKLSFFIPAAIVCVSQDTLQEHQRSGYKAPIFDVIHNGVDLCVFQPSDTDRVRVRKELGVGQDELLVGFVARWDRFKDHETLFKALALLIEQGLTFRCALVGAGMDTSNMPLINLVQQHKLQNHLILAGPRHDIPAVMNALDLHVLSSSAESFGNVVAEAMACGTPCVVTDVGVAALIVGDTGWVVAPRQPTALAAGIELALANLDKQERHGRGQQCRERIKRHFSLDAMVNSYIRLWKEVAKQ